MAFLLWFIDTALGAGEGLLRVWAAMRLWGWFAVPVFGIACPRYWTLYGLMMLIRALRGYGTLPKIPEDPAEKREWRINEITNDVARIILDLSLVAIGWAIWRPT